ncbi:MAG: hypothetical protein D6683_04640 [Actinomyces sp.]|nr:MAG: hypothetical protein D6683_04640 [Actinomyces sp.]
MTAAAGDDALPSESFQDWVSYADRVVVATVVAERQGSSSPENPSALDVESVLVGRIVTFRVDRVLWESPTPWATDPGDTVEVLDWGWIVRRGERIPLGPRFEVGTTYVVPFVSYDDTPAGRPPWGPLSHRAVMVVTDDGLLAPRPGYEGKNRAVESVVGRSPDQLATTLASTPVDPRVQPLMALSPLERWATVRDEMIAARASRGGY